MIPARHSLSGLRPLPPEQPSQVYPYAVEKAALMAEMNELPPHVPYTVMDETVQLLGSSFKMSAPPLNLFSLSVLCDTSTSPPNKP